MPFIKMKNNGKGSTFYRTNKVGAKIATYSTIGLIVHTETFKVLDYGELSEMRRVIDDKYYNHPQAQYRNYKCILYYSSSWIPEALTRMIDEEDTEFTKKMEETRTDSLFVEENSIGMSYHPYAIGGAPSLKDIKEREELLIKSSKVDITTTTTTSDSDRLERAKEESRRRREALFGRTK